MKLAECDSLAGRCSLETGVTAGTPSCGANHPGGLEEVEVKTWTSIHVPQNVSDLSESVRESVSQLVSQWVQQHS